MTKEEIIRNLRQLTIAKREVTKRGRIRNWPEEWVNSVDKLRLQFNIRLKKVILENKLKKLL